MIFRVAILVLLVSTLDCPLPPAQRLVGCASRLAYGIDSSCGLDTWSALLAYLFVSRICVAGLCFCFFALVLFFPFPSDQIGGGFLVCYFFPLFLFFCLCFFGCSDGMEREACVCDHGYERSDSCAEIIIIIIIIDAFGFFFELCLLLPECTTMPPEST